MSMALIRDVAQLGHIELNTPDPDRTVWFFKEVMGLHETHREGQSVHFRGYGEFEVSTLKVTEAPQAGIAHIGWRTWDDEALERRVAAVEATGLGTGWIDGDFGHGKAYRFTNPEGHVMELYYEAEKKGFLSDDDRSTLRNQSHRSPDRGIGARRLDHLHVLCNDVTMNREWMTDHLGFLMRENIVLDDGTESNSWNSVTPLVHDIAISLDGIAGARARLHHAGWAVDNREDVLRAADICMDNDIFIESGPSKHKISQQFFLYVYEPGGNRIEVVAGGYLIFAPDWEPVTWTQAERSHGQAWGLRLPRSFHVHGTPIVEEPRELRDIPVFAPETAPL
ncbi:MAG TPA: catechol 2,3-dioxygenase [Conexibacter sp.]